MSAMRAVSDRMSIPDSHDRVKSTIQNDTPNPRNLGLDNIGVCKPGGTAYGRTCPGGVYGGNLTAIDPSGTDKYKNAGRSSFSVDTPFSGSEVPRPNGKEGSKKK